MYDNQIFDVNGRGEEMLLQALKLAFAQEDNRARATGYALDSKLGMVIFWSNTEKVGAPFPSPLLPEALLPIVSAWLASEPDVECTGRDANADHDGDNSLGWRVHRESHDWSAICAVKPAYLWHGK